jgi:hypothetical protein
VVVLRMMLVLLLLLVARLLVDCLRGSPEGRMPAGKQ